MKEIVRVLVPGHSSPPFLSPPPSFFSAHSRSFPFHSLFPLPSSLWRMSCSWAQQNPPLEERVFSLYGLSVESFHRPLTLGTDFHRPPWARFFTFALPRMSAMLRAGESSLVTKRGLSRRAQSSTVTVACRPFPSAARACPPSSYY